MGWWAVPRRPRAVAANPRTDRRDFDARATGNPGDRAPGHAHDARHGYPTRRALGGATGCLGGLRIAGGRADRPVHPQLLAGHAGTALYVGLVPLGSSGELRLAVCRSAG